MEIAENCTNTNLEQSQKKSSVDSGEQGGVIVTGDRLDSAFSFPVLKCQWNFKQSSQ